MVFSEILKFIWAGICFLLFLFICGSLLEGRFGRKGTLFVSTGFLAGIVLVQTGLLLSGQDKTLVLTLLPLTAYLPAIIGIHILSKSGFFQTAAIWSLGILSAYFLTFLQKLLVRYFHRPASLSALQFELLETGLLLLAAALLIVLVCRYLREPFRNYVLHNQTDWLLLSFPVSMVFLILSYFKNSVTNITILVLVSLTALSVLIVAVRVLVSAASIRRIKDSERAVAAQLEIQRREYEEICKKMEMGRTYRHDMRHHLTVLEGLAVNGNNEDIVQYIGGLGGQLRGIEQETYCENAKVNAVLSSCISRAKEVGCSLTVKGQIPREIPFDDMDICSILANALENAVQACRNNGAAEERWIRVSVVFEENRKLFISVENPCDVPLRFDKFGFPIVPKREGHGIGLKSIEAVTKKYNGLFQCAYREGIFQVKAVLFESQEMAPPPRKSFAVKQTATVMLLAVVTGFFALSCIPVAAGILEQESPDGIEAYPTFNFQWGDTDFNDDLLRTEYFESSASQSASGSAAGQAVTHGGTTGTEPSAPETPKSPETSSAAATTKPESETTITPDSTGGAEELNRQMEAHIQEMRGKFVWYVTRKVHGYVAMDITNEILRSDDALLIVRFDATLNVGGTGQYSRCLTLDKRTGKVLELQDLFVDDSEYIGVISEEILRQMTEQANAGLADYFIPGGIWQEEQCFKAIEPDQNFYIDDQNRLVILFEKYQVAPGKDGMPEFTLPFEKLEGLLRQPYLDDFLQAR